MVLTLNETGIIGQILNGGTNNMTGSIALTLFFIFLFFMMMCIFFAIPLEFAIIFTMPFLLAAATVSTYLILPIITVIIIFVAMILTKNFLFR